MIKGVGTHVFKPYPIIFELIEVLKKGNKDEDAAIKSGTKQSHNMPARRQRVKGREFKLCFDNLMISFNEYLIEAFKHQSILFILAACAW